MKKWGIVLLGWFFIALGPNTGGNNVSNVFTVVPNFRTKADCQTAAFWVRSTTTGGQFFINDRASDCYPDDKEPFYDIK
ncbi:MAG: hypothetical protein A3G49_04010 [Candidatus Sungbacteria bacterium RIFCSPLOWO2_12_FULL_41_11]|uniref:Uncharacterized protein n=1 Tax=Candidatus Sungbacteria bacterium RIFCSPLOWO2_12_FULL_41_11 TaxID=1802286 RepID=A0A1G2LT47_9BACT|nr:MAG: hypothetical protein UV01_C0010G0063 [Parcubacteria group bacterium GW2011_GWA2_42_14]OGZ99302.1 MAG: hypothetical protein A3D41_02480 [Candidatus Sungbacteria bacterium RIFCSPHIGHO2_02_FULL_41_12b]OHA14828.1 MAG: hypothetical protein A3G49_04010 [Candidatus Sungbacteria bacterium RIFCSPLOWO2_12_FULL_41_11]